MMSTCPTLQILLTEDGSINTLQLGHVMRSLGYNPTQGEIVDMVETVGPVKQQFVVDSRHNN